MALNNAIISISKVEYNDSDIDYKLPLSTLLRTSTSSAHQHAETSQGASWLTNGELDREEYVKYLIMLWLVYGALESSLSLHSSNPLLLSTYNPTLLSRTHLLAADISFFLETPQTSLHSHPLIKQISQDPPVPLTQYLSRIKDLSDSNNELQSGLLLAHAYVRYLGDLSGGQVIKQRIAKAYSLANDGSCDDETIRGVEFYDFIPFGRSTPAAPGEKANLGDMKRIKMWFRKGIDESVLNFISPEFSLDRLENCEEGEVVKGLKLSMLQEANVAFNLNEGLLSVLRPPSNLSSYSLFPRTSSTGNIPQSQSHSQNLMSSYSNVFAALPSHGIIFSPSFLSSCIIAFLVAQYLYSLLYM